MTLLIGIGLIEEDVRFGQVFEVMQGMPGQHRPALCLINAWWQEEDGSTNARASLRRLQELGLVRAVNADAPRLEWALEVAGPLWDVLRGEQNETPASWLRYQSPAALATLNELILPAEVHEQLKLMPGLLKSGEAQALIVRGAQRNGRRTVIGAVAQALGCGLLEITGVTKANDERWRLVGPLATALKALPVIVCD